MVCVYCTSPTQVVNSRQQRRSNDIWRRRKCTACGSVFTSIETSDLASALRVENDGILTPFSRDRLFVSIYESCRHRPTAVRDAGNLTAQVIHDLIDHQAQAGLLQRVQIVTATQRVLQTFDAAAAAVYTAYHPA